MIEYIFPTGSNSLLESYHANLSWREQEGGVADEQSGAHLVENHQRRLESTTGTKFAAFDINAIRA
jgi:hypothetical protein